MRNESGAEDEPGTDRNGCAGALASRNLAPGAGGWPRPDAAPALHPAAYLSGSAAAYRSGLAATLKVTKPVITRALDTMGGMGFVDRVRDDMDKRNVIIKRTVAGALYLEKFGDLIIEQARGMRT